ncbi:MAG: bactofilin family protein [Pyrinomonadaceae bacterium]
MTTLSEATELDGAARHNQLARDPFDISLSFGQWLQDVQAARNPLARETIEPREEENAEIYIGSFPGSNCEVTFEGVLHFDGYSIGNISSPAGTLVLAKRGRIEADVNVKVAVINGWVTGNITATERVVLESEARVTGQIHTPALSVKLGAVFDGECLFSPPEHSFGVAGSPWEERSDDFEQLAVAAGV